MTRAATARPATARAAARRTATSVACARAADLWVYLDGELPASRARAVAAHMPTCDTCRATASRLRRMLDECRAAGCRPLPPEVRARARARVRALVRGGR